MELRIFFINAFADRVFQGNPAAVVYLEEPLADEILQLIAAENNLPATGFLIPQDDGYSLRWFSPVVELNFCGHATLAAAHALWEHLQQGGQNVHFYTRGGLLVVQDLGVKFIMNFPADPFNAVPQDREQIAAAIGVIPVELYKGKLDYMAVVANQKEVEALTPNFGLLALLPARGVIVTARGDKSDFVSRCFYSSVGIDEDQVTGSAHTTLTPYWSKKLNKTDLTAIQLSKRKGFIGCRDLGDRIEISGSATTYMEGYIYI